MTKKYILTGGPGSGKTSIILALEQAGEAVIREAAEDFIRLQQARGIREPWLEPDFQDKILELQIKREARVERAGIERVFIDRGVIDGLAYYQIAGREPSMAMKGEIERARHSRHERLYEMVFLVENHGSCDTNSVRREDQEAALRLERLQEQNYRELGYGVERIAPGSVEERMRKLMILAGEN